MANSVSFNRPDHFDLDLIFDCGQSFRFVKSSDCSYSGIAFGKAVDFIQDDDTHYFTCVCFCKTFSHLRRPGIWTPQFCLFLHPGDEGWLGASEAWREGA